MTIFHGVFRFITKRGVPIKEWLAMKRSLHGELKYIFCFLLILLCCILLCSCSAVHEASKARVIERYLDNSVVFDQIVQDIPYQHSGLFRVFMHGSIVVPQEILDLGVKEIYYGPDGIFFEFSHVVFLYHHRVFFTQKM